MTAYRETYSKLRSNAVQNQLPVCISKVFYCMRSVVHLK